MKLLTFVVCLFVTVKGQSQSCSAPCSRWCGDEGLIFPGSNNRIVNVAFGKPARASSNFKNILGTSAPACIAVNGRTSTTYRSTTQSNTNCVHTGRDDFNASWSVDLGRNYNVTNITIYRRQKFVRRMAGLSVTVDGQLCHSFPNSSDTAALDTLTEIINVTCTQTLTGRVVRLQKHGQDRDGAFYYINICEVQVAETVCTAPSVLSSADSVKTVTRAARYQLGHCPRGCQPGWQGDNCKQDCDDGKHGNNCSSSCGHCNHGDVCHHINGTCPRGCAAGFDPSDLRCETSCRDGLYSADCVEQCGQCADSDTCNTVTGLCPNGCQPGWQGDDCKQECDVGKHGNNCSSSCGHCNHGDVCHHINGTCPRGCAAGFDPSDPLCETSCPKGKYGSGCQNDCGNCLNGETCNATTGACPGGCKPGWTNPYCTEVCSGGSFGDDCSMKCTNCSQNRCNSVDGECLEGCKPGYQWTKQNRFCNEFCHNGGYGENCSEQCGYCSGGDQCDPFNGTCASCQPEFKLPLCTVCIGNRYGASCDLNCSTKCGGDGSCAQDTGRCVDGCAAGYQPGQSGFCNDVCEEGKYGEGCSLKCGKCTHSCRHNDGFCIGGCLDGYETPFCAQMSRENILNLVGPLAGSVFGGLCVIALIVGLLIRRSRKRSSSETAIPLQASADQNGLSGQAANQEEAGSAGVTEAEESHIYDRLQTPDDSDRSPYSTLVFKGQQDNVRNSHTYQNSALHTSDNGHDYYKS